MSENMHRILFCSDLCYFTHVFQGNITGAVAITWLPSEKTLKATDQNDWAKPQTMMTSLNGNSFRVTAPLWGESTGHRWIPLTKASDAELWCFLWSAPKQTFEQTIETLWFETPSHENARNPPVTRGFPPTKASGAELWCFLWSAPEQTIEQTIEKPVI